MLFSQRIKCEFSSENKDVSKQPLLPLCSSMCEHMCECEGFLSGVRRAWSWEDGAFVLVDYIASTGSAYQRTKLFVHRTPASFFSLSSSVSPPPNTQLSLFHFVLHFQAFSWHSHPKRLPLVLLLSLSLSHTCRLLPPICFLNILSSSLIIRPFRQLIWVQWPLASLDHTAPTDLRVSIDPGSVRQLWNAW